MHLLSGQLAQDIQNPRINMPGMAKIQVDARLHRYPLGFPQNVEQYGEVYLGQAACHVKGDVSWINVHMDLHTQLVVQMILPMKGV